MWVVHHETAQALNYSAAQRGKFTVAQNSTAIIVFLYFFMSLNDYKVPLSMNFVKKESLEE